LRCAGGFEWRSNCAGRRSRRPTATPGNPGWPALNTVLSERWFDQARFTQRLERGFVLQHETRSTALSARSGGLDDVDGGPDGRVYIQMCGIEQVCVPRLF
jgi:hypothetical protein